MKASLETIRKKVANYNYLIKISFSVIASHFITISEREKLDSFLLSTSYYYKTLIINTLMVFLLLSVIYKITQTLNYDGSFGKSYGRRIVNQIFWGMAVPIFPAIALVYLCFAFNGTNIFRAPHFIRFLQHIILLTITLNFYLFYRWYWFKNKENSWHSLLLRRDTEHSLPDSDGHLAYRTLNQQLTFYNSQSTSIDHLPFNNDGFITLQDNLYQLGDVALKIESERIQHDFITWIKNYFSLSKNQLAFLNSIDESAKKLLSFDISFAIENRLPISLNKPNAEKNNAKNTYSKNQFINSCLTGYKADGTLQININDEE